MKKRSIIALLAISVFFSACGSGGDTEERDVKYYDTLEKAKNKLDWCSKKLNISLDYKKVEELEKSSKLRGFSFAEAETALSNPIIIEKAKNKEKLDTINYRNCLNAAEAYTKIVFKVNL